MVALLSAVQNVRVVMCRHSSGINHSLSGSEKHFLQLPKSQFNQPLESNSGVSCRAWMGKATRASPDPYPCVPEGEDCKSFGTQTGVWPGPKNAIHVCCWYCNHAQGHCKGSGLQPAPRRWGGGRVSFETESNPVFFQQGAKRTGRKARAKTTGVVGSADGVRRTQHGGVKIIFPGT